MNDGYDWNRLGAEEGDYQRRRKGLGIRDGIKNKTAATKDSDTFGQWFFRAIIALAPLTKFGPTNALIKGAAMMGGTHNTKGVSMPFWVDGEKPARQQESGLRPVACDEPAQRCQMKHIDLDRRVFANIEPVRPPIEMLHEAVEDATYLAIMHECLCRKIQGCSDYPLDLGCLFLGPAARTCVARGIAREATREQAHAHIERAKAAGLSASAYFVEVEEYVWGFKDADMPDFLEICFCCPCCCSAVKFEQRAGGELKKILYQRSGWSCVVDESRCMGCGACERACAHGSISVVKGKATVDQWCAGCGQCLKSCPSDALDIHQTGETKPHVIDYFQKLHATL